ncbi:hypothetical protein EYF80_014555 [Liparis tanakae]|uniref:Uncharacterized protein n=1 Tax=Liparis tanakae TaxID=230148 RepID=A0A4Z2ICE5_9TELE|nr:hypothetical protein EYF80_014555 [Liparis tanakae]
MLVVGAIRAPARSVFILRKGEAFGRISLGLLFLCQSNLRPFPFLPPMESHTLPWLGCSPRRQHKYGTHERRLPSE